MRLQRENQKNQIHIRLKNQKKYDEMTTKMTNEKEKSQRKKIECEKWKKMYDVLDEKYKNIELGINQQQETKFAILLDEKQDYKVKYTALMGEFENLRQDNMRLNDVIKNNETENQQLKQNLDHQRLKIECIQPYQNDHNIMTLDVEKLKQENIRFGNVVKKYEIENEQLKHEREGMIRDHEDQCKVKDIEICNLHQELQRHLELGRNFDRMVETEIGKCRIKYDAEIAKYKIKYDTIQADFNELEMINGKGKERCICFEKENMALKNDLQRIQSQTEEERLILNDKIEVIQAQNEILKQKYSGLEHEHHDKMAMFDQANQKHIELEKIANEQGRQIQNMNQKFLNMKTEYDMLQQQFTDVSHKLENQCRDMEQKFLKECEKNDGLNITNNKLQKGVQDYQKTYKELNEVYKNFFLILDIFFAISCILELISL